ncbi:MAG TPA: c-type cytochrome [Flavobacteriaceae bacterium]|nr:c-type cytochrome [Flavobacteriaceae bacterium]
MKKYLLALSVTALIFTSCGDKKEKEVEKEVETTTEEVNAEVNKVDEADAQIALGKKLFTEKTCATCHQPDTKVIGPAIKEMNRIYTEKNGNYVKFLKGESAPIVSDDPGEIAIMKANLDSFVKELTAEELSALAAYMRSVK